MLSRKQRLAAAQAKEVKTAVEAKYVKRKAEKKHSYLLDLVDRTQHKQQKKGPTKGTELADQAFRELAIETDKLINRAAKADALKAQIEEKDLFIQRLTHKMEREKSVADEKRLRQMLDGDYLIADLLQEIEAFSEFGVPRDVIAGVATYKEKTPAEIQEEIKRFQGDFAAHLQVLAMMLKQDIQAPTNIGPNEKVRVALAAQNAKNPAWKIKQDAVDMLKALRLLLQGELDAGETNQTRAMLEKFRDQYATVGLQGRLKKIGITIGAAIASALTLLVMITLGLPYSGIKGAVKTAGKVYHRLNSQNEQQYVAYVAGHHACLFAKDIYSVQAKPNVVANLQEPPAAPRI